MTDDEFIALEPPRALEAVYATKDEAERARLRLLYAQNRGMLVDGSGARLAPDYRAIGGPARAPAHPGGSVDFGAVAARTLAFLTQQGLLIAVVSLIAVGASQAGLRWLVDRFVLTQLPGGWAIGVASFAITELMVAFASVAQGLVTGWAALLLLGDRRPDASVVARFTTVAPMLAVAALGQWAGVTLATFLFVVPGLMLTTAWAVWAPVLAIERRPLTQVFARSSDLTNGSRWTIFGLILVAGLAFGVINIVAMLTVSAGAPLTVASNLPLARYVIQPITGGLEHTVYACGAAALYLELVNHKHGAASGQIAEVFG